MRLLISVVQCCNNILSNDNHICNTNQSCTIVLPYQVAENIGGEILACQTGMGLQKLNFLFKSSLTENTAAT